MLYIYSFLCDGCNISCTIGDTTPFKNIKVPIFFTCHTNLGIHAVINILIQNGSKLLPTTVTFLKLVLPYLCYA